MKADRNLGASKRMPWNRLNELKAWPGLLRGPRPGIPDIHEDRKGRLLLAPVLL